MSQDKNFAETLRRSVHALIHTLGATAVQLQLPAPPVANDDGEELGLRAPEFQWKPLGPVAIRRSNSGTDMLVPADALEDVLGVQGSNAVKSAVRSFAAVLVRDESFLPGEIEAFEGSGRECMYRIALRPHDPGVV